MASSNSQPAKVGSAASPNEHMPVEGGMPPASKAPGNALHGMNPNASTPAPVGGKRKHPAEGN